MLSSFGRVTGLGEVLFRRICGILVHYSSVISLSKKCSWFYTKLRHNKQITSVGCPIVHIFKRIFAISYVTIDGRAHYIYIYIYIYI